MSEIVRKLVLYSLSFVDEHGLEALMDLECDAHGDARTLTEDGKP